MAVDITTISTEELIQDLEDSKHDIAACENALLLGITHYSTGSTQERLEKNKGFIKVISAELERRKSLVNNLP